eukprot:6352807-Prymnesium_polylepis.1
METASRPGALDGKLRAFGKPFGSGSGPPALHPGPPSPSPWRRRFFWWFVVPAGAVLSTATAAFLSRVW